MNRVIKEMQRRQQLEIDADVPAFLKSRGWTENTPAGTWFLPEVKEGDKVSRLRGPDRYLKDALAQERKTPVDYETLTLDLIKRTPFDDKSNQEVIEAHMKLAAFLSATFPDQLRQGELAADTAINVINGLTGKIGTLSTDVSIARNTINQIAPFVTEAYPQWAEIEGANPEKPVELIIAIVKALVQANSDLAAKIQTQEAAPAAASTAPADTGK